MSARVAVRDGGVYLPAEIARRYFAGIETVILLIREGRLLILPVRGADAGGCLLKLRNRTGDRVARAPDAFAEAGLGDLEAEDLPAEWDSERFALAVTLPADPKSGFGIEKADRQLSDKMIY